MESLKPFLLLMVLAGVGYGVYVALNRAPPPEPPAGVAPDWNKPVSVEGGAGGNLGGTRSGASSSVTAPDAKSSAPAASRESSSSNGVSASSLPFGIGSSNLRAAASGSTPRDSIASSTTPGASNGDRTSTSPTPPAATSQARYEYETSRRAAQKFLTDGKLVDALRELSRWYGRPEVTSEEQSTLAELLSQLAGTVIYSRQHWLLPAYAVRSGDTLESVAAQYQIPWQLLAKINGIDKPYTLGAGEELKVVRGPFHAQLDLGQQNLTLFVDGLYAGRFTVQVAGPLAKPTGTYPVVKFAANEAGGNTARTPYISLGGDLYIRVPDDAIAPVAGVRISPRDMDDVFDMLSDRSLVTIRR